MSSAEGAPVPSPSALQAELQALDIAARIDTDNATLTEFSTDFGSIVGGRPLAVVHPETDNDIADLIRFAYKSPDRITVTPRGRGHSDRGQSVGVGGVTINMRALNESAVEKRISVHADSSPPYVDVGGEQLWSELLYETVKYGVAPPSWLDYLDLTVGGTLSVGGISGQVVRHGPQVSNVYELDVITGKGEFVRCNEKENSDLFYAALGGLGQFGVITRARIVLEPAPTRVRWVGLVYTDMDAFAKDEEHLMSLDGETEDTKGFNYLEGFFFLDKANINNWRSPFFPLELMKEICQLASENERVFFIEAALNYDNATASTVDAEVERLLEGLNYAEELKMTVDITYLEFLDRLRAEEIRLRANGEWDAAHPWINMLVPRSKIHFFYDVVFRQIFDQCNATGIVLFYPTSNKRWHESKSFVFPNDERVKYKVGMLLFCFHSELERTLKLIDEMLCFCDENEIGMKQYNPHYETEEGWKKHFGNKWEHFVEMKRKYDPKAILSPGQKIFSEPLESDH